MKAKIPVNNWGRWGSNDELGALNLVDDKKIAVAARLVKQGKVYSLGSVVRESGVPKLDFRAANQHFVRTFKSGGNDDFSVADDTLVLGCHGSTTHVDALCHYWTGDKIYNGFPGSTVEGRGTRHLGIQNLKAMVTRGIMLDVAKLKGVDYLEGGYIISPEDLNACCALQEVHIEPGDVVLFRTGWPTTYYEDIDKYNRTQPGLDEESGLWLARQDICAVGADNSAIGARQETPLPGDNVHKIFLQDAGIYMIEMLELEELSQNGITEFLFVMAPLKILGGTGCSVNPLAII